MPINLPLSAVKHLGEDFSIRAHDNSGAGLLVSHHKRFRSQKTQMFLSDGMQ